MSATYYTRDLPISLMKDVFRSKHGRLPKVSDDELLAIYTKVGDGYASNEERDQFRLEEMEEAERAPSAE